MNSFGFEICPAAAVYFIAALVFLILSIRILNQIGMRMTFWDVINQLLSIILCTILLSLICLFPPVSISWVYTGVFILFTLSAFSVVVGGVNTLNMTAGSHSNMLQ
jgi:hypothetical protein